MALDNRAGAGGSFPGTYNEGTDRMSSTPNWKVYDSNGAYQAACKEPEAAAALMALYGDGSTIRFATRRAKRDALWVEGSEEQPAGESWDHVAITVCDRLHLLRRF